MNSTDRPNVIIVMLDALRPDHLTPWGGVERPTPNFQRLADEGAFFRNCFSHMPSSHPSRASILTGRDPHTHGVRINSRPLPAQEITLPQVLAEAGYMTATTRAFPPGLGRGFMDQGLARELSAFDRGPWDVVKELPEMATDEMETDIAQDVTALIKWMQEHREDPQRRDQPFFLWADSEDTHEPWQPPQPFNTLYTDPKYDGPDVACPAMYSPDLTEVQIAQAIGLYDGVVALLDKHLGRLLDALERLGLADNTLLVVMSDHGVHLGEHNLWRKPPTLFDAVLRATLMMRLPGSIPAGVQPGGLNLVNDVFATVLDLAGVEMPDAAVQHCHSLRPLWSGQPEVREYIGLEFNAYKGTEAKGVRTPDWKYVHYRGVGDAPWDVGSPRDIWDANGWPNTMLFDLVNDPAEMNDVRAQHPEIESNIRERLIDWLILSENDVPAPDPGD